MDVLIVQTRPCLSALWRKHLEKVDAVVAEASTQYEANSYLMELRFDAIIMDLLLENGSALVIAEMAGFHQPEAKLILMTRSSAFCDGSIYFHFSNVCGLLPVGTSPGDIAALVAHHAGENIARLG